MDDVVKCTHHVTGVIADSGEPYCWQCLEERNKQRWLSILTTIAKKKGVL